MKPTISMNALTANMRCERCFFFERFAPDNEQGACYRNPPAATVILVPQQSLMQAQPVLAPQNFTTYPMVNEANRACGEFRSASSLLGANS